MTKQELIKMMGDEDKADFAMALILESIKPEFVMAVLKTKKEKAEKLYEERTKSGYYDEGNKARKTIPEGWSLWGDEDDPEWQKENEKYKLWETRYTEEQADRSAKTLFNNLYVHALWNKPDSK